MFGNNILKIIGNYNFDPVQLQIIEKRENYFIVKFTYYAGGERTNEIVLADMSINAYSSLDNEACPTILEFRSKHILHKFTFQKKRGKNYMKGTIVSYAFGFLPLRWWRCTTNAQTLNRFIHSVISLTSRL